MKSEMYCVDPIRVVEPDLRLDVVLYRNYITDELSTTLFDEATSALEKHRSRVLGSRRTNITIGDPGVSYTVKFKNSSVTRTTLAWEEIPSLLPLKSQIEEELNESINYVVVQHYPHGGIGIAPHRDKEMGTRSIMGLSVGETRDLVLTRGWDKVETRKFELQTGSLYVLNPPTNNPGGWAHSIPPDPRGKLAGPRISFTFRLSVDQ